MAQISELIRIIEGESVFGFEIDSRIRQASKEVPASLMMEIFRRCNESDANWQVEFARLLSEYEPTVVMSPAGHPQDAGSDTGPHSEIVYYLKLIFSNEDAAYYQFPVFPAMDDPLLASGARKREGTIQHLRIELFSRNDFQRLIERWNGNPHLIAIEESSEEEFSSAPSHGI